MKTWFEPGDSNVLPRDYIKWWSVKKLLYRLCLNWIWKENFVAGRSELLLFLWENFGKNLRSLNWRVKSPEVCITGSEWRFRSWVKSRRRWGRAWVFKGSVRVLRVSLVGRDSPSPAELQNETKIVIWRPLAESAAQTANAQLWTFNPNPHKLHFSLKLITPNFPRRDLSQPEIIEPRNDPEKKSDKYFLNLF